MVGINDDADLPSFSLPQQSRISQREIQRDIMNGLLQLSGGSINVQGNTPYRGILVGLEIDSEQKFTDLRMAVAVDGNYSDIRRTSVDRIENVYVSRNSVYLRSSAGGAGA